MLAALLLLALASNFLVLWAQIWILRQSYKLPLITHAAVGERPALKKMDSLWDNIASSAKEVIKTPSRGAVFFPQSDLEEERQRIIENRRAQGLDTPIDMLRDNDHEE